MEKKLTVIIICAALVLVLVAGGLLYNLLQDAAEPSAKLNTNPSLAVSPTESAEPNGTQSQEQSRYAAPDFTVYDLEGNAHKLSDFRGKPVVLNFWASWCGPCKMEMPGFQCAFEQYGQDIHFVMVNLTGGQETLESATSFLAGTEYTFPVYYDTDQDAARTYGIYSIPITYFIDAEGYLVASGTGAMDEETLHYGIGLLIGE